MVEKECSKEDCDNVIETRDYNNYSQLAQDFGNSDKDIWLCLKHKREFQKWLGSKIELI